MRGPRRSSRSDTGMLPTSKRLRARSGCACALLAAGSISGGWTNASCIRRSDSELRLFTRVNLYAELWLLLDYVARVTRGRNQSAITIRDNDLRFVSRESTTTTRARTVGLASEYTASESTGPYKCRSTRLQVTL